MLAPKSARALLIKYEPIEQGKEKLPGSGSFGTTWLSFGSDSPASSRVTEAISSISYALVL
ncbi:hypothetical protein LINPERPRIM_LOCUS39590 [Linum perenne]